MIRNLHGRQSLVAALILALSAGLSCGGDDNPAGPEVPDIGDPVAAGCSEGRLSEGALYQICFPANWDGTLVIYAHGYVQPRAPLALPNDQIGGQSISSIVTGMGHAYATTSYRANGLVAAAGAKDIIDLETTVRTLYRPDPLTTVVVGVSEGGLVAALVAESGILAFDGALALCGPVGSFRQQLNYLGDFRVVFDYLFPGVIPGSPVNVPEEVALHWEDTYAFAAAVAIVSNPSKARELIRITRVPVPSQNVIDIAATAVGILWYNVIGTSDAQRVLGGQPFDNSDRVYSGSSDDASLNRLIARFTADLPALAALEAYETTGGITGAAVTLHTTGDPIVPVEQESLYAEKVEYWGPLLHLDQTSVNRYGHCAFEPSEVLAAFATLMDKVRPSATADLTRANPN
jgi:pimeloyl-ACP methyl ester carboxylesterase